MATADVKTLDPIESKVDGQDGSLKREGLQVDWTLQEEKRAKLK